MDHQWKIVILMDHREFLHSKNEFAPRAQAKINNHFKGKHAIDSINPTYCERCHVISGDYMFVARKFNQAGEVTDERVLDLVVERKSVDDLQGCLIKKSKTCAPLSFFEAQMYKLQQTPGINRIFLMEGDEDKHGENGISRVGNPGEWVLRRKRVKTMRNQIKGDEWKGVRLVCTEDKNHSVQYLVDRMAEFMKEGFDPTKLHLYRTMEEYKAIVNERMKDSTFLEYLRLRKMKGTGDVTAMKEIRNPDGPWDKDFISPACIARDKKYKSNLEDRAEYYVSNNIGGMSKKGNAVLTSQSTPSVAPKENNQTKVQNSVSAKGKAATKHGYKKCIEEQQTGEKNNLRHSTDCPKKKTAKRQNSSNGDDDNQYKTRAKSIEPIFFNKNPIRRTSLVGGGIDADLIASIHSTRHDLTGGSGLGVGGFELSFARAEIDNDANYKGGAYISQTSSYGKSNSHEAPQAAARLRSSSCELNIAEAAIAKADKAASRASHATNEVIVLDDSDDESSLNGKPAAANQVEVIEID